MKGAKISIIQVNEQFAMVQDHHVICIMHFLLLVEPQPMGGIVIRFVDLNDSAIDKFDITLELGDVHTKGCLFFNKRPSNIITYGLINA
jgi:hypothetical protein